METTAQMLQPGDHFKHTNWKIYVQVAKRHTVYMIMPDDGSYYIDIMIIDLKGRYYVFHPETKLIKIERIPDCLKTAE